MNLTHAPTLYLLCGKIAAGKSTLARRLAARLATLLICEDHWTSNHFPANTVRNRDWMRSLIAQADVAHELHHLDIPDAICRQRLRQRNAGGAHPCQVSEAEYDQFTNYFVPPGPGEGFNVVVHTA